MCGGMASQKNIVCSKNGSWVLSTEQMWKSSKQQVQGQGHGPQRRCFSVLIGRGSHFTEVDGPPPPKICLDVDTDDATCLPTGYEVLLLT